MSEQELGRRAFVVRQSAALMLAAASRYAIAASDPPAHGPRQDTGLRIGEVTADSAVIWTRLTARGDRNSDGLLIPGRANGKGADQLAKVTVPADDLEGACPPADGRIRLRYGLKPDLSDAVSTDWVDVTAQDDAIHKFILRNLAPDATYHLISQTTGPDGDPPHAGVGGNFRTAPRQDAISDIRFCVMTCQGYPDRGHPDGHAIYPSMQAVEPRFACLTGDLIYLDNDEPRAVTPRLARYHWERMFSLPRLLAFTANIPTYWLCDDHDILNNDSWPGRTMGPLTFAEGEAIFRAQAPMPDTGPSYRTFRWGRDLQIWLTEGRTYRSPNTAPDDDRKTILGDEQKAWLKSTLQASDATWKILVSPTPIVGPDRKNKHDNHANEAFEREGDELREWFAKHLPKGFVVICGDRHWQYHSVHPDTGLNEFCPGAASDEHAGGSPGQNPKVHRFHRQKGGFIVVDVVRRAGMPCLHIEHRDVDGHVVYHFQCDRAS